MCIFVKKRSRVWQHDILRMTALEASSNTHFLDENRAVHHEYPWVLSSSDDETIRARDWQDLHLCSHRRNFVALHDPAQSGPLRKVNDSVSKRSRRWIRKILLLVLLSAAGHTHYVISAHFHPSEDLMVSACFDETIRVRDLNWLKKKNVAPESNGLKEHLKNLGHTELFVTSELMSKKTFTEFTNSTWDLPALTKR